MEKGKPVYYCNVARMDAQSVNDFRLGLGIKKDMSSPANEDDVDFYIITSPQHLKSLVRMLSDALKFYEKLFGEIKLVPDEKALAHLSI